MLNRYRAAPAEVVSPNGQVRPKELPPMLDARDVLEAAARLMGAPEEDVTWYADATEKWHGYVMDRRTGERRTIGVGLNGAIRIGNIEMAPRVRRRGRAPRFTHELPVECPWVAAHPAGAVYGGSDG